MSINPLLKRQHNTRPLGSLGSLSFLFCQLRLRGPSDKWSDVTSRVRQIPSRDSHDHRWLSHRPKHFPFISFHNCISQLHFTIHPWPGADVCRRRTVLSHYSPQLLLPDVFPLSFDWRGNWVARASLGWVGDRIAPNVTDYQIAKLLTSAPCLLHRQAGTVPGIPKCPGACMSATSL